MNCVPSTPLARNAVIRNRIIAIDADPYTDHLIVFETLRSSPAGYAAQENPQISSAA